MRAIPLLVIAGATGVGKTAAAVALARRRPIEVVSADSRQVYRGMDAATGKPTPAERAAVIHHLIDVVDPDDRYHAARFRADARRAIADIHARGRWPVVVGGTGLYIRALLRGLDPMPPADPDFRRELATLAGREGRAAVWRRLQREAPEAARRLHPNDHVRVVRALELRRAGVGPEEVRLSWRGGGGEFAVVYVGLTMAREVLAARLRARAAAMAARLPDEVRRLLARGYDEGVPAMQSIGYREFVAVARGALPEDEAIRRMQRETLRYAKRQGTWFRREPEVEWVDVEQEGGPEAVARWIEERLERGAPAA